MSQMKLDRPHLHKLWSKRWFRIVCLLGIWTFIGIIFASQLYLFAMTTGWKTTLGYVLRWELMRWCLWAVLTPWIVRFVRTHPIQTPGLVSKTLKHLLMSVLVSLVHIILFSIAYWGLVIIIRATESEKPVDFLEPLEVFKFEFTIDFHLGIFVYWLILGSIHTVRLYQSASQLQLELTRAQLQALKMQIHPHFLFNTLNSISALLHRDPEMADEMVGSLGDFLRLTLRNSGTDEIRLEKEMEFLRCYLEIEQIRFKDRLIAKFELEPETLDAMVPNMLFQPIIENAIKHGVAHRTDLGHIEVRSLRSTGKLRITIRDDGPGLAEHADNGGGEGIGLRNTRARLNHIYGDRHHFTLENFPGGGLLVTVEIPFLKANQRPGEESDVQDTNSDRG